MIQTFELNPKIADYLNLVKNENHGSYTYHQIKLQNGTTSYLRYSVQMSTDDLYFLTGAFMNDAYDGMSFIDYISFLTRYGLDLTKVVQEHGDLKAQLEHDRYWLSQLT